MCFSAPVSFAAGLTLSVIGVAALREPLRPVEKPFAFIPLLFGAQQVIEGILWLLLPADIMSSVSYGLVQLYVLFAGAIWPVLVPVSIRLMEPVRSRRQVMDILSALGAGIALYTVSVIALRGFSASIANQCLVYSNPAGTWPGMLALYAGVVCLPFLLSSHMNVRRIGAAQILGSIVAWTFYRSNLPSVWCFFAAVISVLIYFHLRSLRPVEKPVPVRP